jgi:Pectinacetylesterase
MRAMRSTLLILVLAGCNSETQMNMVQRPPLGDPIATTMNTWTWVDFPGSACDDGSATGIGVNQGSSNNLIVFLNGGGACWDYLTCYQLNTASHGPFGKTQFDAQAGGIAAGTIFDRDAADNPFKDWSFVFVPYCTGDVHAGDNVVMYSDNMGMNTHTYHHTGHRNILEYVPRIAATWPSPGKLVVSGSSAGGYGASFNYDTFRQYWPAAKAWLLDDSGPTLEGDAIPPGYRTEWYAQWRIDKLLDPICGEACKSDFSQAVKILAERYHGDRMALLSSLQDSTIRNYFLLSPTGFQGELLLMAHDVLDPTTNFRYFFVSGSSHTMLGNVGGFTSQGTPLQTWLTQFIADDAAWTSLQP